MNDVLQFVCSSVKKACEPFGAAWGNMTADQSDTIVDQYKGMEIRVQARRCGSDAWRCDIRIDNARDASLHSIAATLHATEDGVSKQAALMGAFIDAMALCDLVLEKRRPM